MEVENFLDDLADSYRRAKRGERAKPLTGRQLYIIELYNGYKLGMLPGGSSEGVGGQNPRLLDAFLRLAVIEADIRAAS